MQISNDSLSVRRTENVKMYENENVLQDLPMKTYFQDPLWVVKAAPLARGEGKKREIKNSALVAAAWHERRSDFRQIIG